MADLLKRKCAAVGCGASGADGKTRLFQFPKGKTEKQLKRRQIWMELSGVKRAPNHTYLCVKHFEDRQFRDKERRYLLQGSNPSRNLKYSPVGPTDLIMSTVSSNCKLDRKVGAKSEVLVSQGDWKNDKYFSSPHLAIHFQNSTDLCGMVGGTKIKQEPGISNTILQNGGLFSPDTVTNVKNSAAIFNDCEMAFKTKIKEEPVISDTGSHSEGTFSSDSAMNVQNTVAIFFDCYEANANLQIKEEPMWLERISAETEGPSVSDSLLQNENEAHMDKDFPTAEPSRLHTEPVSRNSSDIADLIKYEDVEKKDSFKIRNGRTNYEETSICETPHGSDVVW